MNILSKSSTIYVSPRVGNDGYTGSSPMPLDTENGPFKTLERAISAVKEYRSQGIDHPFEILLTDDVFISSPICICGVDRLKIGSFGEKRRIIGGKPITNWKNGTFNGQKCFCAHISDKDPERFTDLYVGSQRAKVTRYPRGDGKLRIVDGENALVGKHVTGDHMLSSSKWFKFDPKDLEGISHIEDAIINYDHFWVDEHSRIESYDKESGMLIMECNSRFSASVSYEENPNAAPLCYFTNVPECFELPGHWYHDRQGSTVYYIPTEEIGDPKDVEAFAPVTDKLFIISGEDVVLENLELTCTQGNYVSTVPHGEDQGHVYDAYASDIQSVCMAPGAITIKNASRCAITDCFIHGVGIYALEILNGCDHIRIEGNHITDVCAGAIRIAGAPYGADADGAVSDIIIRKNHIHGCGKRYLAGCGILLMDASNCEISENEIHDLEYSGISAGWVWGYKDSATFGCIIRKNHVYDIGKGNLSDMGAIYLLGKQKGTVVCENIIHDVSCSTYGAWGIYLDEGSSFMRVEKNLVYRTGRECFHLHYGSHNTVKNNVFHGGNGSCIRIRRKEDHPQAIFEGNVLITDGAAVYGFLQDANDLISDNNILWNTSGKDLIMWTDRLARSYDLEEWRSTFGHDLSSKVEDPCLEKSGIN